MNYAGRYRLISVGLLMSTATIFANTADIKNSTPYKVNGQISHPTSGGVLATFSARPNETRVVYVGSQCPQVIKLMINGQSSGSTLVRMCKQGPENQEFTIKARPLSNPQATDIFYFEEGIH